MGWALAKEARRLGARVTVVSGPASAPAPKGIPVIWVESALQMRGQVLGLSKKSNVVIAAAAVTDWRSEKASISKIKRREKRIHLTLVPNPDIIGEVGQMRREQTGVKISQVLVGFALETEKITESAFQKLKRKALDLVVANSPMSLSRKTSRAILIFKDGSLRKLPVLSKERLARVIFKEIGAIYSNAF
jgi:phosphopantothenoylcysteine decarboxylase/phosphopantothenate--cysteine ligase